MSDRAQLIARLRSKALVLGDSYSKALVLGDSYISTEPRRTADLLREAADALEAAERELAKTRDHAHEVGFSEGYNAATKADAEGADGDEGYPGIAHDFNELEKDRDMWKRTCLHYQSLLGERGLL